MLLSSCSLSSHPLQGAPGMDVPPPHLRDVLTLTEEDDSREIKVEKTEEEEVRVGRRRRREGGREE